MNALACWCGNTDLLDFNPDYKRCPACETLVWKNARADREVTVGPDEGQFYGKDYFLAHQTQHGRPDLFARARADLIDRCPYWLETLLQFTRPPAAVLEIGSSHGAFVSLLNRVGFNAQGIDLSPWVVEYSRQAFGVTAHAGPLEAHAFPPASFDVIVMNDVIEHLPDPLGTLRGCARLLKPGGLVMIQTPAYPAGADLAALQAENPPLGHPFLGMLLPEEHLHLFSRQSIRQLLSMAGLPQVAFEPPYFPQYDMFCFASAGGLTKVSPADCEAALLGSPGGKHALAIIDLIRQKNGLLEQIRGLHEQIGGLHEVASGLEQTLHEANREIHRGQGEQERLNRVIEETRAMIRILRRTKVYRALTLAGQFKWLNAQFERLENPAVDPRPSPLPVASRPPRGERQNRRLIVDLTPVLPGGANGGAKIMALELLRVLSRELAPDWEYILFTAEVSHEELAWLDADNVKRICVYNEREGSVIAGITPAATRLSTARRLLRGLARRLPAPLHRRLASFYQKAAAQPAISSLVKQLDPDLVFAPFAAPFYYHPDIPIVLIIHDLQFMVYPEFFSHEELDNLHKHIRQTFQVADHIITISEYSRRAILAQSGLREDQVTSIPLAEVNPTGRPGEDDTRHVLERFGLENSSYVFFPANFWPHKNHAMLLTAYQMFRHQYPRSNLRLVFTGAPGERMETMRTAVKQMGLEDWVVFAGFVSSADYGCLLNGCKAMIFPSLFEGFGIPVLEAMRFGKAVFCSATTSLPEVGGDAAGMFDPRRPRELLQALETIAFNPERLESMARKSLLQAARFPDVKTWAREHLEIFVRVMDGEGKA